MAYGLQIFNAAGALVFDSTTAAGGVCLGFFAAPVTGALYNFPDFPTGVPILIPSGATTSHVFMGYDYAPGYLRISLSSSAPEVGATGLLFVK